MENTNWAEHERQFGPVNWETLAQHVAQTLTDTFKVHRTWGQIAHTTTESEPKIHISLLARAFNYKTMPASHPGYSIVASSGPDVENPHGMLQRALTRFVRENGGPGETTFTPPGGQKTSFRFVRVDNPSPDVIQYGVVTPDNSSSSGSQSSSRPGSSSGGRPALDVAPCLMPKIILNISLDLAPEDPLKLILRSDQVNGVDLALRAAIAVARKEKGKCLEVFLARRPRRRTSSNCAR